MYHSKVVILCWAAIYLTAAVVAILKKRWGGLRHVLVGASIVAVGIGFSIAMNSELGALLLSIALLAAAYFTLKGLINILTKP